MIRENAYVPVNLQHHKNYKTFTSVKIQSASNYLLRNSLVASNYYHPLAHEPQDE
jgi:hypothetical protein